MQVATTSTADGSLLKAIRSTLADADEALLTVAYVREAGVHLLRPQLERLGTRTRLMVSTTFGSTTPSALLMARKLGADLRVLNPGSGTYHPKAYLARRRDGRAAAVIGSANMTGGLISNVEVATAMLGTMDDAPLARAWEWAEEVWDNPAWAPWEPPVLGLVQEPTFASELLALLRAEVAREPMFRTLSRDKPNYVTEIGPHGLYVETDSSRAKGTPPQEVPAWMFELVWDALRARGSISQQEVLSGDGLNVKRSAAVCAILARLSGVRAEKRGRLMYLVWEAR